MCPEAFHFLVVAERVQIIIRDDYLTTDCKLQNSLTD
jgi:hypothetical protein